jgi:hypothetical protein
MRAPSVQRAELQFANKLLDPVSGNLLANIADLSTANADGTFDITNYIDLSTFASPTGFFLNDTFPPGLVGTDQYALEIMTFLNLAPGVYTFGVDALRNYNTTAPGSFRESGFRLTAGANPRDLFAPEVAVFDKSRPEGEKQFSFVVQQSGIYPFRLLWFSGVGQSSLEWYQITPQGTRVLIGDTASGGIAAYRSATVTHPYIQYITTPKPGEISVAANTPILVTLVDGTTTVRTNTIQLSLNGAPVSALLSNNVAATGLTQVSYQPTGGLVAGSSNTVRLVFSDSGGSSYDQQWSFVVVGSAPLPGLLAVEAEHFNTNTPVASNGTSWDLTTTNAGFSGDGAMAAAPNVNLNVNVDTTISPRLDYNMNFDIAGTYFVWVRALGDSAPGLSQSDSVNVGIDGVLPATSAKITGFPPGGFVWSRTTVASTPATLVVSNTGPHTVSVWMREDGFVFDKLLLTTNNNYTPTGLGPAETTISVPQQPLLTYTRSSTNLILSWTGAGTFLSAPDVTGPYTPVPGGGTSPITIYLINHGGSFVWRDESWERRRLAGELQFSGDQKNSPARRQMPLGLTGNRLFQHSNTPTLQYSTPCNSPAGRRRSQGLFQKAALAALVCCCSTVSPAASPAPGLERFYVGTYSGRIYQSSLNLGTTNFGTISQAAATADPRSWLLEPIELAVCC